MFSSAEVLKVLRCVVIALVVAVVHLLGIGHTAVDDTVLIDLHVGPDAHLPAEPHIPVSGLVSLGYSCWQFLTGLELTNDRLSSHGWPPFEWNRKPSSYAHAGSVS